MTEMLTPQAGIRRELQRAVRGYITGDASAHAGVVPSEDGWFGPDSVTWRIHAGAAPMIGGVQSLLVQTLHPPTMSGVAQHSNYKEDPFGRLHRTANFIGTTTFGSADEAERMVKVIRNVHKRVVGETPAGVPYEANDPHNLAWVHCTEVDGFLRAYRRYGSDELSNDDADRYVCEMAKVGEALGVIDAPRSVSELTERLRSYEPELLFDSQARETVRWIMFPPNKLAAQAPYLIILTAAINLLPGWARRKLWLPPRIPVVSDAMVAPATKAFVGAMEWIMAPIDEPASSESR